MVGYIEDLELINVADILTNVSLNSGSVSSTTQGTPSNLSSPSSAVSSRSQSQSFTISSTNPLEHENVEKLNDSEDSLLRIPNPVGYLQELCIKRGFSAPVYGIDKQEGPSHEPTFSTFCEVGEHRRVVSSTTKKKGKELAAREVILCLRKVIDLQPKVEPAAPIKDESASTSNQRESSGSTKTMNFIGFLQELCVRKHLPPPNYGTEKSTGTPNKPSFYIFCEVGPHREVGIASNKKNAKQLAAEKVLGLLEMPNTFEKESAQAENNENLHTTSTIESIRINLQILSETTLDNLSTIPNPIGYLQELCIKNRLKPPIYAIVKVDGPPHCPTFLMSCKVEHFYQEAYSNNKKKAKELAASKILECLAEYGSTAK